MRRSTRVGGKKKVFTIYQVYFKTDLENRLVKAENLNSSEKKQKKNHAVQSVHRKIQQQNEILLSAGKTSFSA